MANMNGKDFLLGAVTGAVIGAISALLFAPKSGRELRSDISEQYQNVSQKTQELAGKAKEVAGSVVEDIRNWKDARCEASAAQEEVAAEAEPEKA